MKTLINTVVTALAFGAFCLTLGYQQGSDAKWAVLEAEQAASKAAYAKGYNTGSGAGLVAAHKACESYLRLNHCDQVLASAQVLAASEVQ